jgi:hypothetical protein
MKPQLTKTELKEAISEGVDRAFWRMFTGITQAPSTDFWATLEESIERAFTKIADEKLMRDEDNKHQTYET